MVLIGKQCVCGCFIKRYTKMRQIIFLGMRLLLFNVDRLVGPKHGRSFSWTVIEQFLKVIAKHCLLAWSCCLPLSTMLPSLYSSDLSCFKNKVDQVWGQGLAVSRGNDSHLQPSKYAVEFWAEEGLYFYDSVRYRHPSQHPIIGGGGSWIQIM